MFGDAIGNAIHLGERDCSVQRRHQKLIEEAPSPAVSPELRARMGAIAVTAIKSLRYEGAGTLEFLLDAGGEFYFMEMNTRLQVEHPVTEAITGLDLVELQLRVASGEPLGLRQEEINFSGHAIEVRLCSEDAAHDFMPQSGRMALWQMPDGLRVEHALQSGSEIPPFYDSMIAKLISFGATRDEARRRLIVAWNRPPRSASPPIRPFSPPAWGIPPSRRRSHDVLHRQISRRAAGAAPGRGVRYGTRSTFALRHRLPLRRHGGRGDRWRRRFRFRSASSSIMASSDLEIGRERDGGYVVTVDGAENRFEIDAFDGDAVRFRRNGLAEKATFLRDGDRLYILHRGSRWRFAI